MKRPILILLVIGAGLMACRHKSDVKPVVVVADKPAKLPDTTTAMYIGTTNYSNYLGGTNLINKSYPDSVMVTITWPDSQIMFDCSFIQGYYKWKANNNYSSFGRRDYEAFYLSAHTLFVHSESQASRGGVTYEFNGTRK